MTDGYTYVMSDIHGQFKWFKEILDKIELKDNDRLYILGDVVDRGPDGVAILNYIRKKDNIELLLGNHELLMIDAFNKLKESEYNIDKVKGTDEWLLWMYNGGITTLKGLNGNTIEYIESLMDYISNLKVCNPALEVNNKKYYIVHGFPEAGINKCSTYNNEDKEVVYNAVWTRLEDIMWEEYEWLGSDITVIIGHTPTIYLGSTNNRMVYADTRNIINIDCGCAMGEGYGALGCLRLNDMEEFYAGHWR